MIKKFLLLTFLLIVTVFSYTAWAQIQVKYLQIRECSDLITLNSKRSLQDKLNEKIQEELNKIANMRRVISISYTKSEGVVRKDCALATIWYEIEK